MQTFFQPEHERAMLDRLDRLTPDARAQFGKFTPHRMVCHLIDASLIGLGEKKVAPGTGPMSFKPVRWLIIFVLPWPKGKVETHPAFLETQPAEFEADRARLRALLQRIAEKGRVGGRFEAHPAFGNLSTGEWGGLVLRHLDHHLGQFGV